MRVGIVTWYDGNYGSILQAYALQQAIMQRGHEAAMIRHDLSDGKTRRLFQRMRYGGAMPMIRFYLLRAKGGIDHKQLSKDASKRKATLTDFAEKKLQLTERCYRNSDYKECSSEFDAFVCGSDQIWNPTLTAFSPFYWLSFLPEGKPRFSYAPSFGMQSVGVREKEIIHERLTGYLGISLRERSSAKLFSDIGIANPLPRSVLDPTFLLPNEKWESLCDEYENSNEQSIDEGSYLFAYILRETKEQRSLIEEFARQENLRLVVYPHLEGVSQNADGSAWGDVQVFDDDPAAFLSKIRRAKCVITDSFHATVFSLLFGTEFYVLRKALDSGKMSTRGRIDNVLELAGESRRFVENGRIERRAYDGSSALAKLEPSRIEARAYLDDMLEKCKAQLEKPI